MAATQTLNIAINATGNAVQQLGLVGNHLDAVTKGMSNFNKATQAAAFNERLGKVNLKMNSLGRITETGTGRFVSLDKAVQAVGKYVGGLNKRMNTFDMRLLSVMFGGMALMRLFGRINRSIINTFIIPVVGIIIVMTIIIIVIVIVTTIIIIVINIRILCMISGINFMFCIIRIRIIVIFFIFIIINKFLLLSLLLSL